MCGIAGIVDLSWQRPIDSAALESMSLALRHRGPDDAGIFLRPGIGLAARRLSIVGLEDGQQPVYNEDQSVVAVFNGELFDHHELRTRLSARGHTIRSRCDSELLVHLWEDHGTQLFPHLKGQFAFALFDQRRRVLLLARDRVGIVPLFWGMERNCLLFGSEIKALLASGMVPREADLRGLDQVLTMYCMTGPRTAFRGISSIRPGRYLKVEFQPGRAADIREQAYWDFDFPEQGAELPFVSGDDTPDRFAQVFDRAVAKRLRADVPTACYLSGGLDSNYMVSSAVRETGPGLRTFTAAVDGLDESAQALELARSLDCQPDVVCCSPRALADAFPRSVVASDSPIVDPNCGSLLFLSERVHSLGLKVILSGEGADEALAGYLWFKGEKLLSRGAIGAFRPGEALVRFWLQKRHSRAARGEFRRIQDLVGGLHGQLLVYFLTSYARWQYLLPEVFRQLEGSTCFDELGLDVARMRRWHPLNRSLYFSYKTQLPGLLLNHRGDRTAMAHSVEVRYPFLDEEVIDFCAALHPNWKLSGGRNDKVVLRRAAARRDRVGYASRRKKMFRASLRDSLLTGQVPFVNQLLSRESLRRTNWFDPEIVARDYEAYRARGGRVSNRRQFVATGLTAVLGIQLWRHLYFDGGLCDLPPWKPPATADSARHAT